MRPIAPLRALRWRSAELMVVATTSLRIAVKCFVALANSLRPRTGSRSRSYWGRNFPSQRGAGLKPLGKLHTLLGGEHIATPLCAKSTDIIGSTAGGVDTPGPTFALGKLRIRLVALFVPSWRCHIDRAHRLHMVMFWRTLADGCESLPAVFSCACVDRPRFAVRAANSISLTEACSTTTPCVAGPTFGQHWLQQAAYTVMAEGQWVGDASRGSLLTAKHAT